MGRVARLVGVLSVILGGTVVGASTVRACDVCAIYTATQLRESSAGWHAGIGEQFTRFDRLQDDGDRIDDGGQYLNSSITQLLLGYDFTPHLGLQLTVPVIDRQFRRVHDDRLERGRVKGLGDLALIGTVRPYSLVTGEWLLRTTLVGGLKFPTGSAHRLKEETEEGHHDETPEGEHGGHDHEEPADELPVSGIHGHDLALGSGSVDGVIGGAAFASWHRLFGSVLLQYAVRTEGSYDYRYANELNWAAALGGYPLLGESPSYSMSLQAVVSGGYKGNDVFRGESQDDSRAAFVFLGPGIALTWGSSLGADLTGDLPVSRHNTGVQIVPSYRIRGGVTWHF